MKEPILSIKLSRDELDYLTSAGFLDDSQLNALKEAKWISPSKIILNISVGEAEKFREAMADRLPICGFDDNYDLTHEGKILDDLIDRFFAFSKD